MDRPAKRQKTVEDDSDSQESESGVEDVSENNADISQDLYMETVNRSQLDFDQEQVCCVTLSNMNVYSCLVCGKYYAGRSKSTPAFFHSLEDEHHVFINLSTRKVYVLPDGYENANKALDDIKYAVAPTFTKRQVADLDRTATISYDVARQPYRPGFVGMNTVAGHHHAGVILHALSHVRPLRNHLLLEHPPTKSEIVQGFGLLVRKLWSDRLLKSHISPHEFLRKVSASQHGGTINPLQSFATHLLNYLHRHLRPSPRSQESIISAWFQGRLTVESQTIAESSKDRRTRFEASASIARKHSPFLFLALDLPATPLFQDDVSGTVVPQVTVTELLGKYNGSEVQELPGSRRRFVLHALPRVLVLHLARDRKSDFRTERNKTVVSFPLTGLDLTSLVTPDDGTEPGPLVYDLLVNVTHEVTLNNAGDENHIYRVQVRDKATDKWMQMEGLLVQEIKRDMLNVGAPAVMQIWERRGS
ncbi:Related to snRNP-associated protein [Taphrina deformans PYCC 5710]|uniref:Related to snRNP-associated protein n=1 Tax=Taphrina deformans (strain PYCC 5710 / ATCC 11124 / CBS 356.35 / IMI 108563 / JCM 9778 / NBRC 8474) TaxID=1097556 RepID=R4XFJ8_TAPDE|nr:Related to snRNP-associated protein [Taphrina deformans PYCC 5710]|eukprot:CCG82112.1 Related to snRNP-associated protein [Taphrina deformans PYCC 5710]